MPIPPPILDSALQDESLAVRLAYAAGVASAEEWIRCASSATETSMALDTWRADSFGLYFRKILHLKICLQLLNEWESGFNGKIRSTR